MKKKSQKVMDFIENLHHHIITNPQFRKNTNSKTESQIQTELRPLILSFLERYFESSGYKDPVAKANKAFYWEGQEGQYGKKRTSLFASRNYPDFVITQPYLIAVEYKQSESGSTVKHGLGQSIMHTLCNDFHYVYYLFHDQTKDERIKKSLAGKNEQFVIKKMWLDYNVCIKIIGDINSS